MGERTKKNRDRLLFELQGLSSLTHTLAASEHGGTSDMSSSQLSEYGTEAQGSEAGDVKEHRERQKKLLAAFSPRVIETFRESFLIHLAASNEQGIFNTRALLENYYSNIDFDDIAERVGTVDNYFEQLYELGVKREKVLDIKGKLAYVAEGFDVSVEEIKYANIKEMLMEVILGSVTSDEDMQQIAPPRTHYWSPLALSTASSYSQQTSSSGDPRRGPKNYPRPKSDDSKTREQPFTTDKEIAYANSTDFSKSIQNDSWFRESFVSSDFFAMKEYSNDTLALCRNKQKTSTFYHGLSFTRYRQMLGNVGWHRALSQVNRDLHCNQSLYFTNEPLYALMWAAFKASHFAHINTPVEYLTGLVISVNIFLPDVPTMKVNPEKIDDYIIGCRKGEMPEAPDYARMMIVGGFTTAHIAELEGALAASTKPVKGIRRGIQWSCAAHSYLKIENLLQAAILGDSGEHFLNRQQFKVNFVGIDPAPPQTPPKKRYSSSSAATSLQATPAQTTPQSGHSGVLSPQQQADALQNVLGKLGSMKTGDHRKH